MSNHGPCSVKSGEVVPQCCIFSGSISPLLFDEIVEVVFSDTFTSTYPPKIVDSKGPVMCSARLNWRLAHPVLLRDCLCELVDKLYCLHSDCDCFPDQAHNIFLCPSGYWDRS